MTVGVTIPGLRLVSEANAHTHWRLRAKRAKAQRNVVALVLRATVTRSMMLVAPLDVTITRVAPSRGLDSDNLAGSAKHVRDQIAAELGVDDRDDRVCWRVTQVRGAWATLIAISPAVEPEARPGATSAD